MRGTNADDEENSGVQARISRLEEIAETLEAGEMGLERAKELREEADSHLESLRDELEVGDGELIEVEPDSN